LTHRALGDKPKVMASAPRTRLICSSVAELRALCATRLERALSPRVFDNRLNPPRSDYALNPAWGSERVTARPSAVLVPIVARPGGLSVILIQRPGTMAAHAGEGINQARSIGVAGYRAAQMR